MRDGRQRSSGEKRTNWVADFETTTDPTDCRVWAWGLCPVNDPEKFFMGNNIGSFFDKVSEINSVVYFHNLAFDGVFILDALFRRGYTHTVNDTRDKMEFSTLISKMGKYYSITVRWENGKETEFRDSLKKLPMSVREIAETFNMDIGKGEIDYHAPRPVGHIITDEERDYLERDVRIVAKALKVQLDSGMRKLTVGADSMAEFKRIKTAKMFRRVFPLLPDYVDDEIRKAYRGGFTYADPRYQGKLVGPGRVYDVNSLYPSIMYDRVLPYGEPVYHDGLPPVSSDFPLFIVSITFTATLKPDHIPCIQIKGSSFFLNTEYQRVIEEPTTMVVSNVDLALWQEQYDLNIISYNGGYSFRGTSGIFTEYIDKWMEVKARHHGGLRLIAKLHLNSLYGKFATNPDVTGKVPVMENDIVQLKPGPETFRDPVYTAMGVFITAYARDVTIRAAQEHYDIFAYADTDSLHLITDADPEGLDIHESRLGAWKRESVFRRALFIRAKAYTEELDTGEYSTHIAGMPRPVAEVITFEGLRDGARFDGKLTPKRVPGGVVLEDVGFTLNM